MNDADNNGAGTEQEKKLKTSMRKPAKPICFTIMPFGGWFDDYYEALYCPAIIAAGLEPKRADDLYRPSTIVNDIWAYTQKAKLILADLTGKNPNVFYELGLAHALAKPAILVAESINDVPFDLRALRVLEYDKNAPSWGDALRQNITKAIREVLESPLESVLPAFLSIKSNSKPKEVTERDKVILELRRDFDLLRHEMLRRESSDDVDDRRIIRNSEEARALLKNWREMGMPPRMIEKRLVSRGAPQDWVKRELRGLRSSSSRTRNGKGK